LVSINQLTSGISYRPTKEDHQDVLAIAVAEELKKIRQFEEVENKFKVSKEIRQLPSGMQETCPYFDKTDNDEKNELENEQEIERDEGQVVEFSALKIVSTPKRKTKKDRKQEKKERKLSNKKRKPSRIRILHQIDRIDEITAKIEEDEKIKAERNEYKKMTEAEAQSYPRSKYKAGEITTPVLLSDQLPTSLRQMTGVDHYNPFKEQFVSFQKKGIIEPRVRVDPYRKYPKKITMKREHREFIRNYDKK